MPYIKLEKPYKSFIDDLDYNYQLKCDSCGEMVECYSLTGMKNKSEICDKCYANEDFLV